MALAATLTKGSTTMQLTGYFDGVYMVCDKTTSYPVPANYASKSKLIPGDKLKLTIKTDGSLVYKLIVPATRKNLKGILHKKDNKYMALGSDNQNYFLNTAAVSFFKAKPGDEVCLVINESAGYTYAALECVIKG